MIRASIADNVAQDGLTIFDDASIVQREKSVPETSTATKRLGTSMYSRYSKSGP